MRKRKEPLSKKRKEYLKNARAISIQRAIIGRRGGLARAAKLTTEELRETAIKAAKAATEARRRKAGK